MELNKKAVAAVTALKKEYPDAICSLEYRTPHELLIATRLAAQCTDKRVNIVCKDLFAKYRTTNDFAQAQVEDVEAIVKPCGLYKTKARDIVNMSVVLLDKFGGVVPDTIEALTTLPGIGRKTANLIVGDVYGKPAVVCDTHCLRICNRLGLITTKDPAKAEKALREILPPDESNDFCHRLVLHGRAVCKAGAKPKCSECVMKNICTSYAEGNT